jgi:hypothetical protein
MSTRWPVAIAIAAMLTSAVHGQRSRTDVAFEAFWRASDVAEAVERVAAVGDSGASFDDACSRLRAGRPYKPAAAGIARYVRRSLSENRVDR